MSLQSTFIGKSVFGAAGRGAATHGRIVLLGTFVLLSPGSLPATRSAVGQQIVQQFHYPKTATSKSGLRLTIERPLYPTSDSLIDGIRVRVETANRQPSQTRRELVVRFELRVSWNDDANITVPMVLAEGESEAVFDVPFQIPLQAWARSSRLAVAENGSLIGELSDDFIPIRGVGGPSIINRGFSLLVIDRDVNVALVRPTGAVRRAMAVATTVIAPTGDGGDGELLCVDGLIWAIDAPGAVRQGQTTVRSEQPWNLKSARAWYQPGRQLADLRAAAVHPQYAMTDWRWYTEWSMVALSQDELAHLVSSQPVLFEALRRWVSMGGVLLITGNDMDALQGELADRFQLTSPAWLRPDSSLDSPNYAGKWQIPESLKSLGFSGNSFNNSRTSLEGIEPPQDARRGSEVVRWAAYRWGAVVIADRQALARSALPWMWMMQTLPLNGASLDNQSSANMWRESGHHGREWIANTQAAPFPFFLLLVLSFLLVIGPINLLWARRHGSPVRVLLTSPLIASATLAVFVVTVLVSEGIRTRTRVRAVTWLVPDQGEACSWSHQTHYALMPPARLTYPAGTQLTPFLPSQQNGYHYELRVGRDRTTIDGNFLQSRSLMHMCVGDFKRTTRKLSARELPGQRVRVRNRLGTGIELLVLRGQQGNWYLARNINQGGEVRIQATDRATVRKATRAVLDFDEAYDPTAARDLSAGRSSTPVAQERLEWETHRLLEYVDLQPGQFLAVVEDSPFVSSGVSGGVRTRNLELVTGSW